MRTRKPFLRPIAALVSTALLTGGLVGGLATPANAGPSEPPMVSTVSPPAWDNRSAVTLSLTGTNFFNADPTASFRDRVVFKPVSPDAAREVGEFSVVAAQSTSTTSLSATVNLATAPPGLYRVVVRDFKGAESPTPVTPNFSVHGYGAANATSVAYGPDGEGLDPFGFDCDFEIFSTCARGAGSLDITGSNIAIGASVSFLDPETLVADPALRFVPGNPNNGKNTIGSKSSGTGYPSSTLLQGNYSFTPDVSTPTGPAPSFTPGLHKLRITNTDGLTTGATVDFAQPWFSPTAISPTSIGAGAGANGTAPVVLTLTGQGIRAGSLLSVESKSTSSCADVSVGASTVSGPDGRGTFTTISAPVTFLTCSAIAARAVSVIGPDGARFSRNALLTVTGAPKLTSVDLANSSKQVGQGAHLGFTPGGEITVRGTNFVGINETDVTKMTRFTFGAGVTATTKAVLSTGTALITLDVAGDAPVGDRVATAINPDGASNVTAKPSTTSDPMGVAPLVVTVGPKVTSVSPASFSPTTGISLPVTVKGANFLATPSVSVTPEGITITGVSRPDASTLTFSASTNGATPGARDLVITNPTDFGRFVCTGCLGVDSLEVIKVDGVSKPIGTTAAAANSATDPTVLTLTAPGLSDITADSTVALTRNVPLSGQDSISGTLVASADADQATATLPLLGAAPGYYNLAVVLDPSAEEPTTWTCTSCVKVTGAAITTTALTPNGGGQGVTDRPVVLTGTNFSRGMTVAIPDVTVHDVEYVSATELRFQVDVPANAPTGSKVVTVTSGDGGTSTTGSKTSNLTFAVAAAPAPTSISPTSYGQGAGTATSGSTATVKVTGSNVNNVATLDLGPGITVTKYSDQVAASAGMPPLTPATPASFVATIQIAPDAVIGKRSVTVVNGDGGTGTLADAFTVNPGPNVISVASDNGEGVLRPDGVKRPVKFLGTGFSTASGNTSKLVLALSCSNPETPGCPADSAITVENVVVVSATEITADVTVATTAPLGARSVAVSNPADKGFRFCDTCLAVADVPGAVTPLTLTPGASSLKATWKAAAPNGSAISGYWVTLTKAGSTTPTVRAIDPSVLSYTFTGLTNGATYTVTVEAANAAGRGPSATAKGVPGLAATLVAKRSVSTVVYGRTMTFSGTLKSGSAPIAGRAVKLTFYPTYGKSFTQTVATSSTGAWSFAYKPLVPTSANTRTSPYNLKYIVSTFAGDSTFKAARGTTLALNVASSVRRTSPYSGYKSSYTRTIALKGYVAPNKAGKRVYLYRFLNGKRYYVARTTIASNGTYTFAIKPGKGKHVMRIYIPATTISGFYVNTRAWSTAVTLYRV